jgi:hypothetical protein
MKTKRGEGKTPSLVAYIIQYSNTVIGLRKYNSAEPSSFLNNVREEGGFAALQPISFPLVK